ncbi:MAG TPA: arginine repressor [Myxococcaceae bacterium]|jgi:transcriptional regulator of arginine metabolism|nr:arginine repressor [Myxococcaceae bacterium]
MLSAAPLRVRRDRSPSARREAIRELIRAERIETQDELRRLLHREGFVTTQATLSRDLARLNVRRVSSTSGGTAYELEEEASAASPDTDKLAELRALVRSIRHNGSVVVLKTEAGAASAVALAIDKAWLPEVLGTLAGDDTIFLAPSQGTTAAHAANRLLTLLGRGGPR